MGPQDDVQQMITGFRLSSALSTAAELGISDRLAEQPRTVEDLASILEVDADTLHRLLRALATRGVYERQTDGTFTNTALGERLRSDVPGSLRPLARTLQDPPTWAAWGHLLHSVRTGENAFPALHGVSVWEYRASQPEQNVIFNENMTALSTPTADAVATAYDFSALSSVVDVGGGHGILLEAVLSRHERLRGTVFDLPHVVADAPSAAASASVRARWAAASGSFFEAVPPADGYLLKSVLHDWPDEECVAILHTCRSALRPGGLVLLVERLLDRPGHEGPAAFSDLNMLVLPGGRERTEPDYARLCSAAGLRLLRVVDTGTPFWIVEAGV